MPGPKFVLAALPLLLAGCGGEGPFERAAVEGIVTLDGQPLEAGTIVFEPAPGTPAAVRRVPVVEFAVTRPTATPFT